MHNAPPVVVPVGRFVWGVRLPLLLSGLTAVGIGLLAWLSGLTLPALQVLLGVCTLGVLLVWLLAPRERLPEGELDWDGQAWWFRSRSGAPEPVDVQVHWDAGRAMLLRVSATKGSTGLDRYTWLQASDLPLQWHGLRCAVHASQTV